MTDFPTDAVVTDTIPLKFTQFLLPDGRRREQTCMIDIKYKPIIDIILAAKFRFECEVLTTGDVSLTISDDHADYYHKIVSNGVQVPQAVVDLINSFHLEEAINSRKHFE